MAWVIETRLVHKGGSDGSTGKVRLEDGSELIIKSMCVSPPAVYPIIDPNFMPVRVQGARLRELGRVRSTGAYGEDVKLSGVIAWVDPESLTIGNNVVVTVRYGKSNTSEKITFKSPVVELVGTTE